MDSLLRVEHVTISYNGKPMVEDVSFEVKQGEILGIVGESGCGKSVTSMSILRLIPKQTGKIASGEILFEGRDLAKLSEKEMRQIRGNDRGFLVHQTLINTKEQLRSDECIRHFRSEVVDDQQIAVKYKFLSFCFISGEFGVCQQFKQIKCGKVHNAMC